MKDYFKDGELDCKCGCGKEVTPEFENKLNMARDLAGVRFVINSAARCTAHNKKVGGSPTSTHLKGEAADIVAATGFRRFHIVTGLILAGFTRIGINVEKGFIHADTGVQEDIWIYPRS